MYRKYRDSLFMTIYDIRIVVKNIAMYRKTGVSLQAYGRMVTLVNDLKLAQASKIGDVACPVVACYVGCLLRAADFAGFRLMFDKY